MLDLKLILISLFYMSPGVVPPSIMDMATVAESSTPPVDGGRFQERAGLGVYRLLAHQRRRSVGGESVAMTG